MTGADPTQPASSSRAQAPEGPVEVSGAVDPDFMLAGLTVAGACIESGVRDFDAYAKAMIGDIGEGVVPYLLCFYEAIRHYPWLETSGMDDVTAAARCFEDLNGVSQGAAPPARVKKRKVPLHARPRLAKWREMADKHYESLKTADLSKVRVF